MVRVLVYVKKTVDLARAEGIKLGLLRAITLFPFPSKRLAELAKQVKGMLAVEMSAGQMVEDVKLSVNCSIPVYHFGRTEVLFILQPKFWMPLRIC